MTPDFVDLIARKKLAPLPEGWRQSGWQTIGKNDLLIHGGVARLKRSGPNKGQWKWDAPKSHVCVVTDAEIEAERAAYMATTGLCGWCDGGQAWAGWKAATGSYFSDCKKCNATGKAK